MKVKMDQVFKSFTERKKCKYQEEQKMYQNRISVTVLATAATTLEK